MKKRIVTRQSKKCPTPEIFNSLTISRITVIKINLAMYSLLNIAMKLIKPSRLLIKCSHTMA